MKIAISGTHSTGKTTLIQAVGNELKKQNIPYKVVKDVARNSPLKILKDQTIDGTLWIVIKYVMEELVAANTSKVIIVDRTVVDPWAYHIAAGNIIEEGEKDPKTTLLKSIISNWIKTYDVIYQTQLNESIPVKDDGRRNIDPAYRTEIRDLIIEKYIQLDVETRPLSIENIFLELEWVMSKIVD